MIRNAAHDSVCACSVDEVSDAVLHRYAEARQIAEGLTDRAVAALGRPVGGDRPVAVNPSARTRSGLVEITVPGDRTRPRHPAAGRVTRRARRSTGSPGPRSPAAMLGTLYSADDVVDGQVEVERRRRARAARGPRSRCTRPATWTAAARVDGHRAGRRRSRRPRPGWSCVRAAGPPRRWCGCTTCPASAGGASTPHAEGAPLRDRLDRRSPSEAGLALDNGLVRVEVDEATGTFSIDGQSRLRPPGRRRRRRRHLQLVPAGRTTGRRPARDGHGRGRRGRARSGPALRDRRRPTTGRPQLVDGGGSAPASGRRGRHPLELHAGERLVRVTTELDNPSRDHRLRVWFPLPEPADRVTRRVRLRRGRPRARRRGRPHRGAAAHLPVPPLRAGRRAHRGPRGPARVRAGRPASGGRRSRTTASPCRAPVPCAGSPCCGHRRHLPGPDGDPAAAGRAADAGRGPADDRADHGCATRSRPAPPIPTPWSTTPSCRCAVADPAKIRGMAAARRRRRHPDGSAADASGQALVGARRRGVVGAPRRRPASRCGCGTRATSPTTVEIAGRTRLAGRPARRARRPRSRAGSTSARGASPPSSSTSDRWSVDREADSSSLSPPDLPEPCSILASV